MDKVSCPSCKKDFVLDVFGAIGKEQRVSYTVHPLGAGGLIQAKVIGDQISAIDDVFRECAKLDGALMATYIEKLETLEDGAHKIHLAILPLKDAKAIETGTATTEGAKHESP